MEHRSIAGSQACTFLGGDAGVSKGARNSIVTSKGLGMIQEIESQHHQQGARTTCPPCFEAANNVRVAMVPTVSSSGKATQPNRSCTWPNEAIHIEVL